MVKAAAKFLLRSLHLLEPARQVRRKADSTVKGIYLLKFAAIRFAARNAAAPKISRIDNRTIPPAHTELRAFIIVRNESLRLPFILQYYFDRGIDRIFVLDNDSSDETRSIVLSFENTHLFYTKDIYVHQGAWADLLLRRYGVGHWCLVVDADEMLVYPDFEIVSLRELCNFLDRESFDALDCVLLDMYPDKPLSEIKYIQGTDPLQIATWFDRPIPSYIAGGDMQAGGSVEQLTWYCHEWNILHQGPLRFGGGVRRRVFGLGPCISKVPLVKFRREIFLSSGTHLIQNARVADLRGALLHFKFLDDFAFKVQRDADRERDWYHTHAKENKGYRTVVNLTPNLNFVSPISEKFISSSQLVKLRIMRTSARFDEYKSRHM